MKQVWPPAYIWGQDRLREKGVEIGGARVKKIDFNKLAELSKGTQHLFEEHDFTEGSTQQKTPTN